MTPYFEQSGITIYNADCRIAMSEMGPASIDAIVCDPPYGLEFMGKEWDRLWNKGGDAFSNDKAWGPRPGQYKPGYHQNRKCQACGLWDRDKNPCRCATPEWRQPDQPNYANQVRFNGQMQEWHEAWAREALRVLKPGGYLLAFGGTRTFHRLTCAIEDAGFEIRDCLSWLYGSGFPKSLDVSKAIDKAAGAERPVTGVAKGAGSSNTAALGVFAPEYAATDAATDAAKQWEGWGTALKPAWEPIIMARKPIQGTVAENVQRYGTGAINVDGCRIATDEDTARVRALVKDTAAPFGKGYAMGGNGSELGRWPANVALDEEAARLLDQQSGVIAGGDGRDWSAGPVHGTGAGATFLQQKPTGQHYSDTGGASRFFYTAKASRSERGEGNTHPTVKPLSLMRWLVTMVTPPDGCVLDPFMGSGTTLLAAKGLGFRAIGIEMDESYCAIAANRLGREMVGQSELL